ncbi:MAG TPA: MBL fold metallo-hydrolase [Thermotogota bacterium]|nr:MBL fold metallo-hydrolase [Thermotogota bacterium]HRW92564.1 MBL fold metallo-hydrolase [Thermotogota bacterium]
MQEIVPGVLLFDNPFGGSNITCVQTTEGAVVFDASLFPSKASQVRLYIQRFLSSEVALVVNTHYHPDHSFGNSGFSAPLVCHQRTEAFFRQMDSAYIEKVFQTDPALEPETIPIVSPSITFEKEYTLQMGDREILLEHCGGHTPDSVLGWIPSLRLVIAGDIVVNGFHPEIVHDSDLEQWIRALKNIRRKNPRQVICGHGKPGRILEIEQMISYLQKLQSLSQNPEKLEQWLSGLQADGNFRDRKFSEMFLENLRVLFRKKTG